MKSSSICSVGVEVARVGLLLAVLLPAAAVGGKAKQARPAEELTNFLLSPEYSQWLVGAISWMASEREIDDYLGAADDESAARLIEEFWARRSSQADSPWPTDQPRAVFEERAREADRLYSEGTRLGRRSDRGTIFILYGPPEEVTYQAPAKAGRPPVEVWAYPKGAESGLDGERPKRKYYFSKRGEVTVFSAPVPPRRERRPF